MRITVERPALETPNACPHCDRPLNAELACWNCCDRLCTACHEPTGSAFVAVCWCCWFRSEQMSEQPAR